LADKVANKNQLSSRSEVLAAYRETLTTAGDVSRGKQVFSKICAACHQFGGVGHAIGPNLATMRNRGPDAVLTNVLAPNQEVNPQYVNYIVVTTDGRQLTGMIAAETATSVTLKRAENQSDTVLRIDIEELRSTGVSLMPEGMEKQIDKQSMADLLEFLKSVE
jgi:putative heme-binding domain-containing protein